MSWRFTSRGTAILKKLSPRIAEETREDWRDLGYYYTVDDQRREWRLTGSRDGLMRFARAVAAYANEPSRAGISEHEHLGPHSYLTLCTSDSRDIDGRAFYGRLDDFSVLGDIVREQLATARPGTEVRIREQYAPGATFSLVLDVRDDSFDPASLDPQL